MGTHDLQWSSKGTDPVSVANKRICLALLRIFRNVPLNTSRGDYDDIAAPFWPLLREHGELMRKASQKFLRSRTSRKEGFSGPDYSDLEALAVARIHPEIPDRDVLTCIGGVLVEGYSQFHELFDAVEATLMERVQRERVPDKSKEASVDGLNQMFPIERVDAANGRISVRPRPGLTLTDIGQTVLTEINVQEYVDEILAALLKVPGAVGMLPDLALQWAHAYEADVRIEPPVQEQCKSCEFRVVGEGGLKSGLIECWKAKLHFDDEQLAQPLVLDLWYGRRTAEWMGRGIYFLKDLSMEDIGYTPGTNGLSRTQRQWMQISGEGLEQSDFIFDAPLVREEMRRWRFPLNLIDFETSRTALPFHKGGKPFDLVAFQFSHHVLHEDGRIEHKSEFLSVEPSHHPNLEFLRALKQALSGNEGTVFMWSPYENSVLNGLIDQFAHAGDGPVDANELLAFARSLTTKKKDSQLVHAGQRAMVDLCELAKAAFFHMDTRASSSIKKVLPAMLAASDFLRIKYSQPVYGGGQSNSRNFPEPMVWWQPGDDGKPIDPYRLLAPVFSDLELEGNAEDETLVNQGGAAIMAYARLQFEEISAEERQAWERALLRYCELDTLAMVMIVEAWRDWAGV